MPDRDLGCDHQGSFLGQFDSDAEEIADVDDMSSDGDTYRHRRSRPSSRQTSRRDGDTGRSLTLDGLGLDAIPGTIMQSPTSPINDLELEHMAAGALHEDQETGLNRKEKRWRRKFKPDLDIRIGGSSGLEPSQKRMVRDIIVNSLLVLSWYLFSLSISIVRAFKVRDCADDSTTNGCLLQNTWTFTFRCL